MIIRAGRTDAPSTKESMAHLCRTYWYPLYAHVRRRGYATADAQDLTQGFFAHLLAQGSVRSADPARGRFRSFILTALNHFLADEWDKTKAQKRGGGCEVLALDLAAAEQRFELETAQTLPPDQAFDRQWALALLDSVLGRLEEEYRGEGHGELFAALKQTLTGARQSLPYAKLSARLGMSEGAFKVAVHRLRRRYRALLEAEIADTVASPEDARDEMCHLLRALASD
jgi:DNA-directed RNA polymerase specialized sigma24 family protein